MSDGRFHRAKEIFLAACRLAPDARATHLDEACGDDAELRASVAALLAHDDVPTVAEAPTLRDAEPAADHERIGHYRLLEKIGEGGMGVVYLAEQTEPVRRRVALKVIKLGMDTKQVVARFDAERQALAVMDHPHVARVLDAGATDAGRPYFVMEHVPGVPITEHCDRQRLTIDQRLELFVKVCNAIQHAHQKGIIHRDIKPSNVLVTLKDEHDAAGEPKVIDFGVAKAASRQLTEHTVFTHHGQLVGTPEYMSPEQAEMTAQDVDTRSDVYSLGVLLYELLTGTLPFDLGTLRSASLPEIQRIIREDDPPKPSTRRSGLDADSVGSARSRSADPRALVRGLRGDLDWIVMKCLEKDRTRRYETANSLALDIRRHLDHEPVLAGPPGAAYRVRKFVRRNRTGVVAAAIVAAVMTTSTGVSIVFAASETAQRRRADDEATRADEAAARARDEREIAQAINDFLTEDLLAAVAPSAEAGRGRDVLMREVLDEAARRIDEAASPGGRFADMPLVEAAIRRALGETYRRLGDFAHAESHLERARRLRQQELGPEHADTLEAMLELGILYSDAGRYDESDAMLRAVLEQRERRLGEKHPDTLQAMHSFATVCFQRGNYETAERLFRRTLEHRMQILGEEHEATSNTMNNLANLCFDQGRYDEARSLYARVLEIAERLLDEDDPGRLNSLNNFANAYWAEGRHEEAEALYARVLEARTRVLGSEHPSTLMSASTLAHSYYAQGRNSDAEQLSRQTAEIQERVLGAEHPRTLASFEMLGLISARLGRLDEATRLMEQNLERRQRVLGREHPDTLRAMTNLVWTYRQQRRLTEAESLGRESLSLHRQVLHDDHPGTLHILHEVGDVLRRLQRSAEAVPLLRQATEGRTRVFGRDHDETRNARESLARALEESDDLTEAEAQALELLASERRALGEYHRFTVASLAWLADLASSQRDPNRAHAYAREHVATIERVAASPEITANDLNSFAWGLLTYETEALRNPQVALSLAVRANDMTNHEDPLYLDTLSLAYHLTGDTARAIEIQGAAIALLPPGASTARSALEGALERYETALEVGRDRGDAE